MDLQDYRREIDEIDEKIVRLFKQRMFLSKQIGDYKLDHDLPIYVPEREQEKLESLGARVMPEMQPYLSELYDTLFRLSRRYQEENR